MALIAAVIGFFDAHAATPAAAPATAPAAPPAVSSSAPSSALPAATSAPLFIFEGVPNRTLENTLQQAATRAREALQKRWPQPLPDKPLGMIWLDTQTDFERVAGRRSDGVLALTIKDKDLVLLNGPLLRQSGLASITETLRHEMVHINFERAGVTRLPRWLEEGLAMRLSEQIRWSDGWQLAADRLFGNVDESGALWGGWAGSAEFEARAYRQAASMTDFLIRKRFPVNGEAGLVKYLLDPPRSENFLDELWTPSTRMVFYEAWRDEGGKLGPIISLLFDPNTLFGVVCVALLLLAWRARRLRMAAVNAQWEEDGPYYSAPGDDIESPDDWDEDADRWEKDEDEWDDKPPAPPPHHPKAPTVSALHDTETTTTTTLEKNSPEKDNATV
ncbi:MAG: hypothetical protein NTX50_08245 [Candidatus Sumerlaeota bacterium]|nr:hypothetical protein [Candidatus Sumerlaeota bacterium]